MAEGIDTRRINKELSIFTDQTRALSRNLKKVVTETHELANKRGVPQQTMATGETIVDSMVKIGAIKEIGETIGHALGVSAEEAGGADLGYTVSSVVQDSISGAAIGSVITSSLATAGVSMAIPGGQIVAIATLAGALLGMFEGAIKAEEKKFAAINNYVVGLVNAVGAEELAGLQQGILSQLEMTEGAFYQAETAWQTMQSAQYTAKGEGYAVQRTNDLNENLKLYEESGLAEAMKEIDQAIGQSEAYLVGRKDDYKREALALLVHGTETGAEGATPLYGGKSAETLGELHIQYSTLRTELDVAEAAGDDKRQAEIGIELKGLKAQAETMAESMFEASDISLKTRDTELLLIEAVRENTDNIRHAWSREYYRAQVLSGAPADQYLTFQGDDAPQFDWGSETNAITSFYQVRPGSGIYGRYDYDRYQDAPAAAYGLNRVPYDNFPALLHQGERVLTASQARAADRGGGVNVTFSGPVTVREEADLDKLARKLAAEVRRAKLLAVT